MRINFESDINTANLVNPQTQVHHSSTTAPASDKNKDGSAFVMSIGQAGNTGIGTYSDKKDMEEWQETLGASDVQIKRDYMSVMSLSMSDEDYATLVATGQPPQDMDAGDGVTILDEIKAAIIKGGGEIQGYTDTVDKTVLAEITGSEAVAAELVQSMTAQDVPINEENVRAAAEAVELARQIIPPAESALQYLMDNGKAPTIQNIYEATHSGTGRNTVSGEYMSVNGYVTGMGSGMDDDLSEIMPQIENVIKESGLELNDNTRAQAMWLIDRGIGLTPENLLELDKLNSIQTDNIINAVSIAMGAGIAPEKANLTYTESIYTMAEKYYAEYMSDDKEQAIDVSDIRSRRMLEEIRLTMTVEANRLLLRSNFQIDIAPMEKLVEALKLAEQTINEQRFPADNPEITQSRAQEYKQVKEELAEIPGLPAAILGETTDAGEWRFANFKSFSLHEVYEVGVSRREIYAKAETSYETLMTAPRADLGDSMRKAFRNVDDILEDLKIEINEENRRAVRILGYNSMEINAQSVAEVRQADETLRRTIDRLTPSRVLRMIREDVNPLKMTVEQLGEYLNNQDDEPERKAANYAKFLMQLEKQDEITELERESYIGIYRMLSGLDKNDDAAIGAIINTGVEFSFANMLSAMRSAAKSHMDYKVSDDFGGVDSKISTPAIDAQINAAYEANRESMDAVTQMMQEAATVSDREIETIINSGMDVSLNNLEVADLFKKRKGTWFETVESLENEASLEAAIDDTLDAMTDTQSAVSAYDSMLESMKETLSRAALNMNSYIDVKAMQSSMRQISFLQKRAQNENYEFPANIDGEVTSIRLQIRHMSGAGELTITMETELMGKLAAQFNFGSTKSGFVAYEKAEGVEFVDSLIATLSEQLPFVPDKIHAPNISLDKFTSEADSKEKSSKGIKEEANGSDINNTELYRVARMFIGKARLGR